MSRRAEPLAPTPAPSPARGPLWSLAPVGRLVELTARAQGGALTTAVGFVRAAQREGAACAWVQPEGAGLYPPDLAAAGVCLDALVVVHAPRAQGPVAVARAAELLLRSGGFGLLVLDLTAAAPRGESWVTRLGGLARRHAARVVLLTAQPEEASSAGALVALRACPRRRFESGRYVVDLALTRDRCGLAGALEPCAYAPPWEPT